MKNDKKYKQEDYKPDMRNMTVIAKSKTGKNQVFLDKKARRTYNRKELCDGMNNGEIIGGHVRVIKGIETPCKNPRK